MRLGSSQEITVEGLAYLARERTASSSSIHFIPCRQAFELGFESTLGRVLSLENLERLMGLRPSTPLPEMIDRLAACVQSSREPVDALGELVRNGKRSAGRRALELLEAD